MANHYTNLPNDLKSRVHPDEYALFSFNGVDMWDKYNCFIVNNKGSLKFYNGPSFSNSYTKPQFESASSRLTGVTFNTQQITFTVGVYAITEEKYRELIYFLNPYTIGNLIFHFDSQWRYLVKLAKIADSNRDYIGKDSNGKDLFYTELNLTFEVQGDSVAQTVDQMGYCFTEIDNIVQTNDQGDNNPLYYVQMGYSPIKQCKIKIDSTGTTNLQTPFKLIFSFYAPVYADQTIITLQAKANTLNEITLFSIALSNYVKSSSSSRREYIYTFMYDSQTGNLYLKTDTEYQLLTLLTTNNKGLRIVDSLIVNKYLLPGNFDGDSLQDIELILNTNTLVGVTEQNESTIDIRSSTGNGLETYGRTTLI